MLSSSPPIVCALLPPICDKLIILSLLRVVQTQAILFLISMSEIGGSDIERLGNRMMDFQIESKWIEDLNSESLYVGSVSF